MFYIMSTHIFPFVLIKFIESSVTPLSLCKWRQPAIVERGTKRPAPSPRQSLSGTQPGLGRAAEMTQTLQHRFLDPWEGGKCKVWKKNSTFQICQRPGLSLCKLGSVRTSLFATCWLYNIEKCSLK